MATKKKPDSTLVVKGAREITITVPQEKLDDRKKLIDACGLVLAVDTAEQQEAAIKSLAPLKLLAKDAEKDRKELKAPILAAGTLLDETIKTFVAPIATEVERIEGLIATFQRKERERAAAAERERQQREAQEARERAAQAEALRQQQEAAAKAARDAAASGDAAKAAEAQRLADEAEQAQLEAELSQSEFSAPAEATKLPAAAKGASVKVAWDFEVTDILALFKAYPHLVELSVKRADAKAFINLSNVDPTKIPGIRAFEATKVAVRAAAAAPTLEA